MRIVLDEYDFRTLIEGGVVNKNEYVSTSLVPFRKGHGESVQIILADIGYVRMLRIITDECKRKRIST